MKAIAGGFVILGGALIGGGGVAILAALGPVGWLAAGLTALGIAAGIYKGDILKFISGEWITSLMTKLNEVQQAFTNMLQRIIDWIGNHIPDWIKKNISYTGGGFGGGGIIKTSFGVSGGAASGPWSADVGGTSGNPILSAIDAATGGDARTRQILRNIYGSESGGTKGYASNLNGEDSWGPFQLNRHGGLGALFEKETGLSVRTQSTIGAQAKWVADYVRRHRGSLSQWRGLEHPERFSHTYGGYSGSSHPAHLPPPRQGTHVNVHNVMTLDGKVIATSVSKHFVRSAQYSTSVGRQDGRGTFMMPGAEIFA